MALSSLALKPRTTIPLKTPSLHQHRRGGIYRLVRRSPTLCFCIWMCIDRAAANPSLNTPLWFL